MAQYISVNGTKFVQLDDGDLVPAQVPLSIEGGILAKLPLDQLELLQQIELPETYPLPADQVTNLKTVTVSNFPASFQISNFPAGFNVANLPATFPLPLDQEALVSNISGWVLGLDKGAGSSTANTLRTAVSNFPATYALPTAQQDILTGIRTRVDAFARGSGTTSADTLRAHVSNFPTSYALDTAQMAVISGINTLLDAFATGSGATDLNTLRSHVSNFPSTYALPTAQADNLAGIQTRLDAYARGSGVTDANTLRSHVSNFPASFQVSNFPTTYALPTAQADNLAGIQTRLDAFARGSGATDTNTLRVHTSNFPASFQVSNFPSTYALPTAQADNLAGIDTQIAAFDRNVGTAGAATLRTVPARVAGPCTISAIAATVASTAIAAASATRRALKIYNNSGGILYLAIGANAASTTSWSLKLFPDDYWEASPEEAGLQVSGWFTVASGSALVTTGA